MLRVTRLRAIAIAGLLCSSLAALPSSTSPSAATPNAVSADRGGRLVVLGFDGADGRTVEEMMDAGQLPNMQALRDEGTFTRLGIISPPESPVSWASLNTGQNPAKTGVPGFVKRNLVGPGMPFPGMGHLVNEDRATADMEGVPIPLWSAGTMAGVAGGAILVGFLIVFAGLLRMRFPLALGLSVILGCIGGWAGYKVRGYVPDEIPRTTNPNKARNFWDYAADAGVESIVLEAAQAFDQKTPEGAKVLAGLGVPDARGKIGDWFIYTNDELEFDKPPKGRKTGTAGTVFKVDEYDGRIETKVYGPTNFWRAGKLADEIAAINERLKTPGVDPTKQIQLNEEKRSLEGEKKAVDAEPVSVDLVIERQGERANVTIDNQSQSLAEGEWSDWFHLSFELNTLLKVNAITRVKLLKYTGEDVSLFVSQLHLDPASPPFWQPVSQPPSFSSELVNIHGGPFETYGWPTLTMPFKDKMIDAVTLLEDVQFTMTWRDELTEKVLDRDDWRILMSVFSTTDRVQHMMYQYYDEEHPMYDAAEAARTVDFFGETITFAQAVPKIYERMDDIIGRVKAKLGPDDTLLVCSDHGFQSFRRQVHINNWLAEKGYLAVKKGVSKRDGDILKFIDWSKTRAYAMGLGFIYLNMQGREQHGIVQASEADGILRSIRDDLLESTDPQNGLPICTDAYLVKEIHNGPYLDQEADMICGFAPTYRVSWSTTMGGLSLQEVDGVWQPGPTVVDNNSPWSGGHVSVDTDAVAGVFFSNRKVQLDEDGVHQLDLAPTALAVVGVQPPSEMDRAPITFLE